MIIKCPVCGLECESEQDIPSGQKIQCPNCEKAFIYEVPTVTQYVMPEIITTGVEFEEFLCKHINKQDGMHCEMTKASGDQGVDLVVEVGGKKVAIQCKLYSEPVGNEAVQQVVAGRIVYKCDEAVVVTNSTFTKSAEDLARATQVRLVNYKEIIEVLEAVRGGKSAEETDQALEARAIANGDNEQLDKIWVRNFKKEPSIISAYEYFVNIRQRSLEDENFMCSDEGFKILALFYVNMIEILKNSGITFVKDSTEDLRFFGGFLTKWWRLAGGCFALSGNRSDAAVCNGHADDILADMDRLGGCMFGNHPLVYPERGKRHALINLFQNLGLDVATVDELLAGYASGKVRYEDGLPITWVSEAPRY